MRPQTTTLALLEEWDTAVPALRELAKASPDDGTPLTELARQVGRIAPAALLSDAASAAGLQRREV